MTKLKKKFDKILRLSTQGGKDVSSILFDSNQTVVSGLGPDPIKPFTALLYMSHESKSKLIGHVGNKQVKEIDESESIVLAIDNRNIQDPIMYLANDTIIKFDTKSILSPDTEIFLYWEYGPYSLLIFSGVDPVSNESVIQSSFCNTEDNLKDNRFLFLNLLPEKVKNSIVNEYMKQDHYHVEMLKGQVNE